MFIHRLFRQRGTISPHQAQYIDVDTQNSATLFELALQSARGCQRQNSTINRYCRPLRSLFCQPVQRAWLTRLQLDQFDSATGKLFASLLPVTAVSPQSGKGRRHDQRTD